MSTEPFRMTLRRVIENPAVFQALFNGQSADLRTSAQSSAQLLQRRIGATASIGCHAGVIDPRQLPQQHIVVTASQRRGAPAMTRGNGQVRHDAPPNRYGTSGQPPFNGRNGTSPRPPFNRRHGLTTAGGEGKS